MSNILQLVENEQTSEFYPTPESLVKKMLGDIDLMLVKSVLEPSAGKGDILRVLAKEEDRYGHCRFDVDCIEIDANLRQILSYNFSKDRERELKHREEELKPQRTWNSHTGSYDEIPSKNPAELEKVREDIECFFADGIHIVHDDFLTYTPFKQYNLIIMNPPFSNGDRHLLKALQMQKNGGYIICLLNAETILNPYTETRKALVRQLEEYEAEIEYIEDAFTSAERRTGVEIALIKVSIPQVQEIENGLEALKELVGGYIEVVRMEDNILIICNEEGKMQGLPPNFSTGYDVIVGTVVFVAFDGKEDFTGLSDWQIETIMSKFY